MRVVAMTVGATACCLALTTPAALGAEYNQIRGTMGDDKLHGTARADLLGGRAGDDNIRPNRGTDIVRAAGGDDRVYVFNDGDVDRIHCGQGFDVVAYHFSVDQHDIIDPNCEGVIA